MGLFFRDKAGVETPVEAENLVGDDPPATPKTPVAVVASDDPRIAKLQADLEASNKRTADLEATVRQNAANAVARQIGDITTSAKAFANALVKSNQIMPPGAQAMADLHAFVHLSAADLSTEGLDPVASFATVSANLPSHRLTGEALSNHKTLAEVLRLDNGANGGTARTEEEEMAEVRRENDEYYAARGIKPAV